MRRYKQDKTGNLAAVEIYQISSQMSNSLQRNAITSMASCRVVNFYRAKRVLQYDVTSGKAFVTEKSITKTMSGCFRLLGMTVKILLNFDGAASAFRNQAHQVQSYDFWRKYLE